MAALEGGRERRLTFELSSPVLFSSTSSTETTPKHALLSSLHSYTPSPLASSPGDRTRTGATASGRFSFLRSTRRHVLPSPVDDESRTQPVSERNYYPSLYALYEAQLAGLQERSVGRSGRGRREDSSGRVGGDLAEDAPISSSRYLPFCSRESVVGTMLY